MTAMNWFEPVDIYCERLTTLFWAEPINAASNISFVLAALIALLTLHRLGRKATGLEMALIALAAAIGVGSFLFHTFANRWSEWADTIPIWGFVGLYIFASMTASGTKSIRFKAIAGTLITAGVAWVLLQSANGESGVTNAVDPLNGSGQYAPALIALICVSVLTWIKRHPGRYYYIGATWAFIVSLGFRTFDISFCDAWPIGTHFVWHLTNGLMIGLLLQAYIRRR